MDINCHICIYIYRYINVYIHGICTYIYGYMHTNFLWIRNFRSTNCRSCLRETLSLYIHICIYIYRCIHTYTYKWIKKLRNTNCRCLFIYAYKHSLYICIYTYIHIYRHMNECIYLDKEITQPKSLFSLYICIYTLSL